MRTQHKVSQATPPTKLDSLVGTRVMEIEGRVKGSFRVGDKITLVFERTDGKSQMVDTVGVSDWLLGNEVEARLLVRATKESEFSPLRLAMIGAAPDGDVRRTEEEAHKKAEAKRVAQQKARERLEKQRAAQAKMVPQGGPLSGSITRYGTRLTSRSSTPSRAVVAPIEAVRVYSQWIRQVNPRLSDQKTQEIARAVIGFGLQSQIDPRFVMAILLVESGFRPNSVSRSGAMGLGQLMPKTAAWLGVTDPFDTTQNLYGAIKLLRRHLVTYYRQTGGDPSRTLTLALAAYNAGEGAVRRHGGVPPYRETQAYVKKVRAVYDRLCSN